MKCFDAVYHYILKILHSLKSRYSRKLAINKRLTILAFQNERHAIKMQTDDLKATHDHLATEKVSFYVSGFRTDWKLTNQKYRLSEFNK